MEESRSWPCLQAGLVLLRPIQVTEDATCLWGSAGVVVWAVGRMRHLQWWGRKSDWLLHDVCIFSLISLEAVVALRVCVACLLRLQTKCDYLDSWGSWEEAASTLAFALVYQGEFRIVCLIKHVGRMGAAWRPGFVSVPT